MLKSSLLLCAAALAGFTAPAFAEQRSPTAIEAPPAPFARAVQCRAVADPAERLACYDREVGALQAAEARKEIRVVDRQQVSRTRRSLFGLTLPDLNIFGGDPDDPMSEITGTIRSARQDPYGKWTLTLEDGARWAQIDSRELNSDPKTGQSVRIRRAAMGSFLANVGSQRAMRVRRVQ